jgi:hypothetical protein
MIALMHFSPTSSSDGELTLSVNKVDVPAPKAHKILVKMEASPIFSAAITYGNRVRDLHKELRDFYYQKMLR